MTDETKKISLNQNAENRHLCFTLGEEHFAIPLLQVKEVIAVPEFTPISYTPGYFCGIMNLRGKVISVIDLRKKLGIKSLKSVEENSVIVCDLQEVVIGVLVDSVDMVVTIQEGSLLPKPSTETSISMDYINGFYHQKDDLIIFLNIAKALSVEDLVCIHKASESGGAV